MKARTLNSTRGQILLPALTVIVISLILSIEFVAWATRSLWQMRMDVAADAAALSAARAQAEMLNTLSTQNVGLNLYLQKSQIPFTRIQIGGIKDESMPGFKSWNDMLQTTARGFSAFPAGVGEKVARLNGAEGYSPYFPFPMNHQLIPLSIIIGTIVKTPPWVIDIHEYEHVFFARGWSPGHVKAQPPHKTTWLVSHGKTRAMATARLWLDIKPGDLFNNGGFPRPHESWIRNAGIQGFYPQFNARLFNLPAGSFQSLWNKLAGAV